MHPVINHSVFVHNKSGRQVNSFYSLQTTAQENVTRRTKHRQTTEPNELHSECRSMSLDSQSGARSLGDIKSVFSTVPPLGIFVAVKTAQGLQVHACASVCYVNPFSVPRLKIILLHAVCMENALEYATYLFYALWEGAEFGQAHPLRATLSISF